MITREQIEELASRAGVRRIAVLNFLGTVGANRNALEAGLNFGMDAKLYNWNAATQTAILDGIQLHFKVADR